MNHRYKYPSNIQQISQIRTDLAFLEKEWTLPASDVRQILLIVEELFSNIIRHAFQDTLEHLVELELSLGEGKIEIHLIDDGRPFNPLEYDSEPSSDPVGSEDRGMGITLIRAFSRNMTYQRLDEKNHLIIEKKIKSR